MPSGDDDELLKRWRDGDRQAGDVLLRRHFPALFRFFRNKVGHQADELIQRTLTACLAAPAQYRGDASFRTYLFRIARHELYRYFKRDRPQMDPLEQSVADLDASMTEWVAGQRAREALLLALRRLPLDLQIVLELHYWEGLTMFELASALEIAPGTAKSRIRRAREALLRILPQIMEQGGSLECTLDDLDQWVASVRGILDRP